MEHLFLMAGFALVVLATVFRRSTNTRSARASPAISVIEVRDRAIARSMLVDHADTFSNRPVWPFHVKLAKAARSGVRITTEPHGPLWRTLRCNLTAGILHLTVVSCVEWTLAHLVIQPEVQEKLRRQLDTLYLRAVILESLRLHPPVAVIQREVVVGGAAVAAGTPAAVISAHAPEPEDDSSSRIVRFTILPGATGRDSRAWTDADEFRPEWFLAGGDGEVVGPMPGPKDIRMLPFGAGTRHCPGMGLGLVHVRLLLAELVRAFQWGATGAPVAVDLTEVDGFVKHMKTPLMARITPRT